MSGALREIFASFGIEVNSSQIDHADNKIHGLVGKLEEFAKVAAGLFGAHLFVNFIEGIAEAGDQIAKTSDKIGVARGALQEWQFAAQLAGVDAGTLTNAFGILQRNAFGAAKGSTEMGDAFKRIGVNVKNSDGTLKDSDTLMTEVAGGLAGLTNDSERTALSMAILGRSGKELLPLFKDGAAGVAKARAELEELGGVMSDDLIDQSVEFKDDTERLGAALGGLKNRIGMAVIPIFDKAVRWFIKVIKVLQKLVAGTRIFQAAMVVLGAVVVKAALAMAAPFIPMLAAVTAVVLIVDDLITLFEGGDSAIGKFIDSFFGFGAARDLVITIRDAFDGVMLAAENAAIAVEDFFGLTRSKQRKKEAADQAASESEFASAAAEDAGRAAAPPVRRPGETARAFARRSAARSSATTSVAASGTRKVSMPAGTAGAGGGAGHQTINNVTVNANVADGEELARKIIPRVHRASERAEGKRNQAALQAVTQGAGGG